MLLKSFCVVDELAGGHVQSHFAFRSPELKNVSRETFGSGSWEITPVSQNAPDLGHNRHSIVSGVSANSFFSESQAKAAARANLPERIDNTMYTVSG
jgi:hypothetical protein